MTRTVSDPYGPCGRCGVPMPIMGFRRCTGKPRSREDGNICYPESDEERANRLKK